MSPNPTAPQIGMGFWQAMGESLMDAVEAMNDGIAAYANLDGRAPERWTRARSAMDESRSSAYQAWLDFTGSGEVRGNFTATGASIDFPVRVASESTLLHQSRQRAAIEHLLLTLKGWRFGNAHVGGPITWSTSPVVNGFETVRVDFVLMVPRS